MKVAEFTPLSALLESITFIINTITYLLKTQSQKYKPVCTPQKHLSLLGINISTHEAVAVIIDIYLSMRLLNLATMNFAIPCIKIIGYCALQVGDFEQQIALNSFLYIYFL